MGLNVSNNVIDKGRVGVCAEGRGGVRHYILQIPPGRLVKLGIPIENMYLPYTYDEIETLHPERVPSIYLVKLGLPFK